MPETGNVVRITIIDSGINPAVSNLAQYMETSTGFRVNDRGYITEDAQLPVKNEHGTAIALIIRQLCPQVQFISINILNERLAADCRVLLAAMEAAITGKPDIIHLSLGTTKWRYILPMKQLIRAAHNDGILLVSAAENRGRHSYPAYLKGVIGVKGGRLALTEYAYAKGFFHAPFGTEGIAGADELERRCNGNSMAAGYITGHAACLLHAQQVRRPGLVPALLRDGCKDNRREAVK